MSALFQSISNFFWRLLGLVRGSSSPSTSRPRRLAESRDSLTSAGGLSGGLSGGLFDPRVSLPLRQLVYQATYELPPQKRTHAAQVGALFRKKDRSFSYEKYNFTKLIDLLEAVPDLVQMEKVEPDPGSPSSAPVYYVRPVTDMRGLLVSVLQAYEQAEGWVHLDSLQTALTRRDPSFSSQRYGFKDFESFIQSRSDLIEFKVDSPAYVRLALPSRRFAREGAAPALRTLVKPQRMISKRPRSIGSPAASTNGKVASERLTSPVIEPLSKMAGFSMDVLNQKVSELAAIALPENWYFGSHPPSDFAYPILKSYLRYTFIRLQHEAKVIDSEDKTYRAFNTGLLDTLLRPIYGLFTRPASDLPNRQWNLVFCIAGEGYAGKKLVAQFGRLPAAANYFTNADQAFYHLAAGAPQVDWQHVVKDNMARLPLAFLVRYAPAGFTPRSTQGLTTPEFFEYKRSFVVALEADPASYRGMVNRLEDALDRTLRRTQINYKTAVPTYYPKINSIDLLLPLCLVDEETVDLALVVRREPSGKYIGHTILTLRQAYNNARLICKLDEHWLTRSMALSALNLEDFDEGDEDEASEDLANEGLSDREGVLDSAIASAADSLTAVNEEGV